MGNELQMNIKILHEALEAKKGTRLGMVIGVDGFVDVILHVVAQRADAENYTRMAKIEELGQRIINAGGLSANIELVTQAIKLGGNGPILSNALLEYGVGLTYVGALGDPNIHPVFKPMAEKSQKIYSLCDPSHTDAMEFEDGKLMFGKHSEIKKITWDRFKEVVGGVEAVAAMITNCNLFGMENWTMVTHMSEIWDGLIREVFPLLPDLDEKPFAFFDLADPEKRSRSDILEAMGLIGQFQKKFHAILGLNEKELYEIAEVFDLVIPEGLTGEDRLKFTTTGVYDKLGIYCLVVHPTKEAACCVDGKYYHTAGPYCQKPLLTTGAGDNFNAGFCFGQALGLDPQCSLTLGVATSGYYVRNAKSPTYNEQLAFLTNWINGDI